ncbi:MAG: PD40 domain-containing protein [Elusimicrobia bacterium]|nr:PD40 domain-containing protein [Elusimicrobiota bacterium]
MYKRLLLSLIMILLLASPALAAFGQNKTIVQDFKWQVMETPHFYVHYYLGNEVVVEEVVRILENGYQKVTKNLNIEPVQKIPFFLYATHNDFEQNNIGDGGEGVGGFTEIFKDRFVVPLNGSDKWLTHVIEHEMTHALVFEFFFGGRFWRSIYLFKSLFYPLWFIEGLSEYQSAPDDIGDEMVIRDAVINNNIIPLHKLGSFDHLQSNQIRLAYNEGHSALSYIAEKYGPGKISDLLYLLKDSYDISSVLGTALKKDIFKLNKEWEAYLKVKYANPVKDKKTVSEYGVKITDRGYANQQGRFSPDGKRIVFLTDRRDYYEFFQADPDGRRPRTLLNWFQRKRFDNISLEGNIFSFSPDSQSLVFSAEKLQQQHLFIYDFSRHRLARIKVALDEVTSPSFSPDGQKIIFSGLKKGYSDIYQIALDGKNLTRLTNDTYDDTYPLFTNDGKGVVYVSEREKIRYLYRLNLETNETKRITASGREESAPFLEAQGQQLYYIGGDDGIYNVYRLDLTSGQKQKLTAVKTGLVSVCVNRSGTDWLLTGYNEGRTNLYLGKVGIDSYQISVSSTTIPTLAVETTGYQILASSATVQVATNTVTTADLILKKYPYHFKATTDYILPIFVLYAGTDGAGFASATYWQISDLLGNHVFNTGLTYSSADNLLNYALRYQYSRWRPQFSVTGSGATGYDINNNNDLLRVRRYQESFYVTYPLDRFHRVEAGLANVDEHTRNRDQNDFGSHDRANVVFASFTRDYTTGELFDLRHGHRVNINASLGRNLFHSDVKYDTIQFDWQNYWTARRNLIIGARLVGVNSSGRDYQTFTIGNRDNLRGYSQADDITGRSIALANLETRFYLFRNIDYDLWFMLPDLYFKSLQAVVFTDNGLAGSTWDDFKTLSRKAGNIHNSIGAGLRLNSFIMQRFPIILRLDYARRTEVKSSGVWYFNLGASF